MFCFPYKQGIRSENADTASLQDKLTGRLIGLARATDGNEHLISESSTAVIVEGLSATLANGNFGNAALEELLDRVEQEKRKMVPDCFTCASPCGKNSDYNMEDLWNADEAVRSLKSRILCGIREAAAYACHAAAQGYHDDAADRFFYKALIVIGLEDWGVEDLIPMIQELDEIKRKCAALCGKADTVPFTGVFPEEKAHSV